MLLLLFLCGSGWGYAQVNASREAYILKYKDIAIKQMQEYGIPASITLSQACIETGYGTSRLARNANNHFGILCHDWKGETISLADEGKAACFRKYNSDIESFNDYAEFLRYHSRYASLFDLPISDYVGWAHGLKQAGYATNPQYASALIQVIEDYKLYEYDRYVSGIPPSPKMLEQPVIIHSDSRSPFHSATITRIIYKQNGVSFIVSQPKDSYASLAREFLLFKREIICYNDLRVGFKKINLEAGTVVYVAKKKREAVKGLDKHIVEGNESLHAIAQRYAVRLKSICKYNGLQKDVQLHKGKGILLRKRK